MQRGARTEEDTKIIDTITEPIVVTTSGWKRILMFLVAFFFVASGVYFIFNGEVLLGSVSVGLFTYLGIYYFKQPPTLLIADRGGITPVYILTKGSSVKIPWQMIENIYIAKQPMRGRVRGGIFSSNNEYLAVKAKDRNNLIPDEQMWQTAMRELRRQTDASLDDGGGALFYIPVFLISGYSPDELVYILNTLRKQASPQS